MRVLAWGFVDEWDGPAEHGGGVTMRLTAVAWLMAGSADTPSQRLASHAPSFVAGAVALVAGGVVTARVMIALPRSGPMWVERSLIVLVAQLYIWLCCAILLVALTVTFAAWVVAPIVLAVVALHVAGEAVAKRLPVVGGLAVGGTLALTAAALLLARQLRIGHRMRSDVANVALAHLVLGAAVLGVAIAALVNQRRRSERTVDCESGGL